MQNDSTENSAVPFCRLSEFLRENVLEANLQLFEDRFQLVQRQAMLSTLNAVQGWCATGRPFWRTQRKKDCPFLFSKIWRVAGPNVAARVDGGKKFITGA